MAAIKTSGFIGIPNLPDEYTLRILQREVALTILPHTGDEFTGESWLHKALVILGL
jgi:hypothetical protein